LIDILLELKNQGFNSQIVPIGHLDDLREEIERQRIKKAIPEEVYNGYLSGFNFTTADCLPAAASIIIVAVPQPQIKVRFNWNYERHAGIIPPTYLYNPNALVEALLKEKLEPVGYRIAKTALPLKLLATRCDLGFYGRNNLCYISEMGSFHRLMAFFSDLPCSKDIWHKPQMMARCKQCLACYHSCPTGAISTRHFHLRAERCLTFHNESKNDWPSWIHPEWHHCLVGCLQCQRFCPENKKFLGWIEEKEEFSAEETELVMWGCPFEELPKTIQEKLNKLSLTEYYPAAFSRNLRCLFENSSSLHRNGRLDIERNIYQRGEQPWSKNRR